MSRSSSEASDLQPRAQTADGQRAVSPSLARLRDAFGADTTPQQTSPSSVNYSSPNTAATSSLTTAPATRVAPLYQFGVDADAATAHDTMGLQASPIDLDRRANAGLFATSSPNPYSFQSPTTASPVRETQDGTPKTTTTAHKVGGGMSGAREYFHVSPPSPMHRINTGNATNNENNTSNSSANNINNNNSNSSGSGAQAGPLFPPQPNVTHHAISSSDDDNENNNRDASAVQREHTSPFYGGGAPAANSHTRPTPPPALQAIPPPPSQDELNQQQQQQQQHERTRSGESSSSSLSPPRSPARPLTAEEEQLARLRAYNEMSDTDGSATRRGASGDAGKRSFIADTFDTLLPNGVTRWFSRSADVVAHQSSTAVPEGVKRAASAAASTIGSGAQHIGDAIEHMPGMVVNAIPNAIMSTEVKQLLFTDFSNTFRSFFHTNILSMPFIIRQAGLVGGIFLLTFVAITSEYATEAYFGAKNQMKNAHKVVVYGDVPKMVWGRWYPMINIFYGITHLIGFIAFSASNSVVLLGAMGMKGGGARALGLIVPSLIALPMVLMKNAHSQEPLSIMSNLLVFTAVILMFVDFPYTAATPIKLWPSSATEFFVALGVSVYAFTGIGSCIPVERVMAARRYRKLLRASVAIAYAILMAFGLSGFLSYGNRTCSVMTVSLQKGPLRTAVSALLFFASIMIIPQQTFPLCELSDRRLLGITRLTTYWDWKPNLMRVMYLVVSAFAAFIIPYYGLLLSISGALGCGIVGLVVPAALDYVRRERRGLHHGRTMRFWEYLIVFGLGFYGCVVVVIGVVSGSYQLWLNIQTQSSDTC